MAHITSTLKVGDLTLRNRNIMASMARSRSFPDTVPNDLNAEYYTQRARGGAGLILTEASLTSPQGTELPDAPGIWSDAHVKGWRKVTDSVHEAGSLIFCQLWHVGRLAHPDMEEQKKAGKPVPAPSAIAARGGKFRQLPGEPGYVTPTALEDPWTIVEEFKNAAEMAKAAGFDGVELHSAYGYIIQQFLDTSANKRTDKWGGSVENRCRLGLEVTKALIEIWGPARVGIKINPCAGTGDLGMSLPDTITTYTHYITQLCSLKLAYIQLVRYIPLFDTPLPSSEPGGKSYKRATPLDVLAIFGPLVKPLAADLEGHDEAAFRGAAMPAPALDAQNPTPTRLFLNGGLMPAEADKLIEEGKIDAAVFGALWLANQDLQKRIEKGMDVGGKGISLDMDPATFYGARGVDPRKGYTDYPTAT